MKIAVFDIGGTSVKHALYENKQLTQKSAFSTPQTFAELQQRMQQVISDCNENVEGIAISSPGIIKTAERRIEGISAVPYLHQSPVLDEFETYFDLAVTVENDANCAGLCEMEMGAGKGYKNTVFVVIGTGIGGSIFINGRLYKGAHLYAGEFGLMKNEIKHTADYEATVVWASKRYTQEREAIDGKLLFERAAAGDELAQNLLAHMYDRIAALIYNIQVSIDPEIVILGGGISAASTLIDEIKMRVQKRLREEGVPKIMPEIKAARYGNDANLLGAALYHFI